MDIAALSMSMAQTNVMTQVGTAVLAMGLDTIEQTGAGVVDLISESTQAMERSVNPNLGGNIDILV
ncbi:MAG: YjfB family protein [Lachnospiraceae bacterium]|nr:YjfB family protein [Lachnospiraceae bacterium]